MGIIIKQSVKGTVWTYLGAVLGFVTQFFIVTKFLDLEVIGLTKVFYEVGILCTGFALLGITNSGMRFYPYFKDQNKGNNGFFFYYTLIPLIGFVLVSYIYCLCREPIIMFFSAKSPIFSDFFYLVVPLIFILTFWQVFENYSNINMKIAFPKEVREVFLRIFLMVAYLLYAFGKIDINGLMYTFLASYGFCMIINMIYIRQTSETSLRHDRSFITPELKNKYLKYTGFLLLAAVSGNIMSQLDLFMLSSVKGMYSAGVYTIALYMANIVDMPSRSILAISTPLAADALKNGDLPKAEELYRKVSIHQMMITSTLLLLLWINIDNIYSILPNGDKFSEGRYVVLFLGLSKIITTTLGFGGILIQFSRYYYWTLFISIFLTVLTIFTNLWFIPRMGVSGAALATFITCVISYCYQQYLVQRKVKANPLTWKTVEMLAIIIALWAVNKCIPSLSGVSPWLDIVMRSGLILLLACYAVLKLRISTEVNAIADRVLGKMKR